MIELRVEEYCHTCPQFSPVSETKRVYPTDSLSVLTGPTISSTVVICEHAKVCQNIAKHIKKQLKESEG